MGADDKREILAINCGSSSLKYAIFDGDERVFDGTVDHIGSGGRAADHGDAVESAFEAIGEQRLARLAAVGHRLVHGGPHHRDPERVDDKLLAELERVVPFAPLHLPPALRAIGAVQERAPELPQIATFDTAFHASIPEVAHRYALPDALYDAGIRRYGFHGLSYEFVVGKIGASHLGRAVIAHLGSGASLCAVRDGRSVDTTMGFTPSGGIVMGTRAGDLDPGLFVYLVEHRNYDGPMLERLFDEEAGLVALSGGTSDMATLLRSRKLDPRAALAVDVFIHHARKAVAALTASLGGIDTLVFTGGIGEHAPEIRDGICASLGYLGIALDKAANVGGAAVISSPDSRCNVRVVATDEESVIARHTAKVLTERA